MLVLMWFCEGKDPDGADTGQEMVTDYGTV